MTDPLKNLKRAMDQTVFREMSYSERQKRNTVAQADEHNQDHINILILKALQHHTKTGYSLFKELQQTKAGDTLAQQEGLLYLVLHKLEQQELISSSWENSGTGKVKVYYIEKKGLKTLINYYKKMSKGKQVSFVLDIEGGLH